MRKHQDNAAMQPEQEPVVFSGPHKTIIIPLGKAADAGGSSSGEGPGGNANEELPIGQQYADARRQLWQLDESSDALFKLLLDLSGHDAINALAEAHATLYVLLQDKKIRRTKVLRESLVYTGQLLHWLNLVNSSDILALLESDILLLRIKRALALSLPVAS